MTTKINHALDHVSNGFYVFPLEDNGKRPRPGFTDWETAATTDPARIRQWWQDWPNANIAIATGKSGVVVIDIDPAAGGDVATLPLEAADLRTVSQATGGGGVHYFYRQPPGVRFGNANSLPQGVDSRGHGGYIVAPGSIHPDTGVVYTWLDGQDPASCPVAALPYALGQLLKLKDPDPPAQPQPVKVEIRPGNGNGNAAYVEAALRSELAALAAAPPGRRNDTLNKAAFALGQLVAGGELGQAEVEAALTATALGIGLTESETRKTIKSGLDSGMKSPRTAPAPARPELPPMATNGDQDPAAGGDVATLPLEAADLQPIYTHEKGRTVYHAPAKSRGEIVGYTPITVADFTASITQEITAEDGRRSFGIEGATKAGRPFGFEINTEDFSSDNRLKAALTEAAGAKAPIYSNMSRHLGPSIQYATNGVLKQIRRFDRTGWSDGRFLIPGREPEDTAIHLPPKLVYGIDQAADFDQGLTALEALLFAAPGELSTVALAFVFQAPLAELVGWRKSDRYALFVSGQTGTFKTSFLQCAMSIYGPGFLDDTNLIRFGDGATKNAMQHYATHCYDLPILIDNYKPGVYPGEPGFYALLHAIVEGGEKDRLNRNSELREARPIYTWPVFTGEDTPDKDAASLARVLKLDWTGGNTDRLTEAQTLGRHLQAVGDAWLTWLESDAARAVAKEARAAFPDRRKHWADLLKRNNREAQNIMRLASNIASNELTWQILSHADSPLGLLARSHFLPERHRAGLEAVALAMANETAGSLEAIRYLEALQEILRINSDELPAPGDYRPLYIGNDNQIGWIADKGDVYLKPKQARRAVDDLLGRPGLGEVSNDKLYKQIDSLGLLGSRDPAGKTTVVKKFKGQLARVLHLAPAALLGFEG